MSLAFAKGKALLTVKGIIPIGCELSLFMICSAFLSIVFMYIMLSQEINSLKRKSPLT